MTEDWLQACQTALQYRFHDLQLLKTSLTHSSKKSHPTDSNERLEFFGDAILGFVISEYIFKHNPKHTEGDLTKIKSVVVSRRTLAEVSRRLQLCDFMRVGKGVAEKKGMPVSLLANVLEAVIGAVYLDGGMEAARRFIIVHIAPEIIKVELGQHEINFKSLLQQYAQRELGGTPTYSVVREEGLDHVKQFHVMAVVKGKEYATASGRSKKEAEQQAAEMTLRGLMEANAGIAENPDLETEAAPDSSAEEKPKPIELPPPPGHVLPS
jgi:ribonuclease-3